MSGCEYRARPKDPFPYLKLVIEVEYVKLLTACYCYCVGESTWRVAIAEQGR